MTEHAVLNMKHMFFLYFLPHLQTTRFLICRHQLCHASEYFKSLLLTHRRHEDIHVISIKYQKWTCLGCGLWIEPSSANNSIPMVYWELYTLSCIERYWRFLFGFSFNFFSFRWHLRNLHAIVKTFSSRRFRSAVWEIYHWKCLFWRWFDNERRIV